jgi:hypothetical protein
MSDTRQSSESTRMETFVENLLVPDEDVQGVQAERSLTAAITIVVEVATWIMQNQQFISDVAEWWAVMTNGVTNIKRWQNETDQEVEVWKLDGGAAKRDRYRIPPGQTINADMWAPWADHRGTGRLRYDDHHAVIMVGGAPLAYLWQSGSLVRFNTSDAFVYGGVAVPGASGAGGNRTMIIAKDPQGRKGFALGTYKR